MGTLARREIDDAKKVGIPAIHCLEVVGLTARGQIELNRPTLECLQSAASRTGGS